MSRGPRSFVDVRPMLRGNMGPRMSTYEITQRLMSVSAEYDVTKQGDPEPTFMVKGELMTTSPTLRLMPAKSKEVIALLQGNVLKTKFQVRGPKEEEIATINFSAVAFRKTFTMTVGGKGYHASAGVVGVVKDSYACADNDGKIAFILTKEPGIRDRFVIEVKDDKLITSEVAILAAVAVHSRFYE